MEIQEKPLKIHAQTGNALIITLVIIGLLAGLTLSLTRMSSKTSGNVSDEKARMSAESLMRTAQSYESAIQKLVSFNRCSENEFNFKNDDTADDYTNSGAPSDKHCDIFDVAGAGMKYTPPDASALDDSMSSHPKYGDWAWKSYQCVLELGTGDTSCAAGSEAELLMVAPYVNEAVCLEINRMNGVTNTLVSGVETPPTESMSGVTLFTGSFGNTDGSLGDIAAGDALKTHATGCFKNSGGTWTGAYVFYHVLLVR